MKTWNAATLIRLMRYVIFIFPMFLFACGGGGSDGSSDDVGAVDSPSISVEKLLNGNQSNASPGTELVLGDIVEWTFNVTNTGDVALTNIIITDTIIQPVSSDALTVCETPALAVGETYSCTSPHFVVLGQYESQTTVSAQASSATEATINSFYVGVDAMALAALPNANPSTGTAPLTVTFSPDATTNNAIIRYEWDFDNDGTFDFSETVGRDRTFTYSAAGEYTAVLRVTDSNGEQETGSIQISVGNLAPQVTIDLNPSNGEVPLTVNFLATATDINGIAQYEWDYDGDGTYDETTTTGAASNIYTAVGAFQARLRVVDTLGASTELTIPTLEVKALPAGSPSVNLAASVVEGVAPLNVTLTAAAVDSNGGTIDQYEWDIDGDGSYDETTTVGSLQTSYTNTGTFFPRVRVTDSDNQQAEDTLKIFVEPQISLSVSIDTIDPFQGETVLISTTLGGDMNVSVVIENAAGQAIRTLVPLTSRTAGNYDDTWDGRNDDGDLLPEAQYRAILLHELDGSIERFDLGLTTGGVQSNPRRSSIPSSFSPLAGDPLDITFTLNQASEVTAFMGLFNINTRLVTFMQRQSLGRGSHTVTWNGESSEGNLIEAPTNDRFLFGIFAYTLPDNAIFLRSGVHVGTVAAEPSIYQPTQLSAQGAVLQSSIAISLSREGSARLMINDADSGATVASFTYDNLAEGDNIITWDGRDNSGALVAPGTYRLGVAGLDENGYQSLTVYALQRIYY